MAVEYYLEQKYSVSFFYIKCKLLGGIQNDLDLGVRGSFFNVWRASTSYQAHWC